MTILFETQRLITRPWIPKDDAEQAFSIYGDPEVTHFIAKIAQTSVELTRQFLYEINEHYGKFNNGTGYWAIIEKATTKILGSIIIKQLPDQDNLPTEDYEVGWHLRRDAWGQGYATEAGRGMLNYGFNTLSLSVIYAVVKPENQASIRVTQRLGMKPLGRTNKYYGGMELLLFQLEASQYES